MARNGESTISQILQLSEKIRNIAMNADSRTCVIIVIVVRIRKHSPIPRLFAMFCNSFASGCCNLFFVLFNSSAQYFCTEMQVSRLGADLVTFVDIFQFPLYFVSMMFPFCQYNRLPFGQISVGPSLRWSFPFLDQVRNPFL